MLPPIPLGPPKELPKIDIKSPADIKPPSSFDPPGGLGTPTVYTKPAGTPDVKPLVPEIMPKTDFDVDLYNPQANDTYDSISQEYYNDRRFAPALKAFNRNLPLQGGRFVEVPPIHILKRKFPAQTGTSPVGAFPATSTPDWGPASKPDPTPIITAGNTRGTFIVPQGGMTMKAIARLTLGSEQRWGDIWSLNPHLHTEDVLAAGVEVKLPGNARLP